MNANNIAAIALGHVLIALSVVAIASATQLSGLVTIGVTAFAVIGAHLLYVSAKQ